MSDPNTYEPDPTPNSEPACWLEVIKDVKHQAPATLISDMILRDQFGREKYGVPLQPNNGRRPRPLDHGAI